MSDLRETYDRPAKWSMFDGDAEHDVNRVPLHGDDGDEHRALSDDDVQQPPLLRTHWHTDRTSRCCTRCCSDCRADDGYLQWSRKGTRNC